MSKINGIYYEFLRKVLIRKTFKIGVLKLFICVINHFEIKVINLQSIPLKFKVD